MFNSYGFSFSRVVAGNAFDLSLPVGSLVKLRDGTLVLDGGTYYIISEGKALAFAGQVAMIGMGYKTANVISAGLSAYEKGIVQ